MAEPVVRETTPRFKVHLWGCNGQSPGPTIEVDRDFVFLLNAYDIDPGSYTPKSARQYGVTADIAVGQMRQLDFLADEEVDWAFHRHKCHRTMNAEGPGVPTMIGVDHSGVARQITQPIPDYMVMGQRGMKDMTGMETPLPDNTAAMMTGQGPFDAVGMGCMFSMIKVRVDGAGTSSMRTRFPLILKELSETPVTPTRWSRAACC